MIVLIILSMLPDLLRSFRMLRAKGRRLVDRRICARRPRHGAQFSLAGLLFSRIEIDGNSGGSIRRTRGWAVCSTTGLPSGPPNERRDATESQRPLQEYVTAVRAG